MKCKTNSAMMYIWWCLWEKNDKQNENEW